MERFGKKKIATAWFIKYGKKQFVSIYDEYFIDKSGQLYVHKLYAKPRNVGYGYYLEGTITNGDIPRFTYLKARQMNLDDFVQFSMKFNMKELPYV